MTTASPPPTPPLTAVFFLEGQLRKPGSLQLAPNPRARPSPRISAAISTAAYAQVTTVSVAMCASPLAASALTQSQPARLGTPPHGSRSSPHLKDCPLIPLSHVSHYLSLPQPLSNFPSHLNPSIPFLHSQLVSSLMSTHLLIYTF